MLGCWNLTKIVSYAYEMLQHNYFPHPQRPLTKPLSPALSPLFPADFLGEPPPCVLSWILSSGNLILCPARSKNSGFVGTGLIRTKWKDELIQRLGEVYRKYGAVVTGYVLKFVWEGNDVGFPGGQTLIQHKFIQTLSQWCALLPIFRDEFFASSNNSSSPTLELRLFRIRFDFLHGLLMG